MVQDFGRPLHITVRPIYGTAVLSACLSVCNVGVLWPNGYIKMPLGTEIGLGPGDIVLDGYPAPHGKGHSSRLHFSVHVYCGQTAECIRILFGTEVGLGSGVIVLHGDPRKGAQQPPTFGPCLLRPNGRPSQQQC